MADGLGRNVPFEDPDPLPGGKIGFWSWQENLPVIARAKIAFAGEG